MLSREEGSGTKSEASLAPQPMQRGSSRRFSTGNAREQSYKMYFVRNILISQLILSSPYVTYLIGA